MKFFVKTAKYISFLCNNCEFFHSDDHGAIIIVLIPFRHNSKLFVPSYSGFLVTLNWTVMKAVLFQYSSKNTSFFNNCSIFNDYIKSIGFCYLKPYFNSYMNSVYEEKNYLLMFTNYLLSDNYHLLLNNVLFFNFTTNE